MVKAIIIQIFLIFIILGTAPDSSYFSTRVAAVAAATLVVAVLLVMVGPKAAAGAAAGVATVLVMGTWFAGGSGGVLSKTRTLDLGLTFLRVIEVMKTL